MGRSLKSVSHRIPRLRNGVSLTRHRWTAAEDAVVIERVRQGHSAREISERLAERSLGAVENRMLQLRAVRTRHQVTRISLTTDAQIQQIIDMRLKERKSFVEVAAELGCGYSAARRFWQKRCVQLLSKEELAFISSRDYWTPAEVKHLTELYTRTKIRRPDAALHFPSKGSSAVSHQIHNLNLIAARRQYQTKLRDQVQDIIPVIGQEKGQMTSSSQQKRSYSSFSCNVYKTRNICEQRRAFSSSSSCNQRYNFWSATEDRKLLELLKQGLSHPDICKQLEGRTITGLRARKIKLDSGAPPKHNRTRWSIEEDATLLEKYGQGLGAQEISTYLPGRTFHAVEIRISFISKPGWEKRRVSIPSRITGAVVQRILDMSIHEHKTKHEIATELGRSIRSTQQIWFKYCAPRLSEEELRQILSRETNAWSPAESSTSQGAR